MSSFRDPGARRRFVGKVVVTAKTHKAPGKVTARVIHATVGHPCAPFMRFIAQEIRQYLSSARHLLKDSFALVKRLRRTRVRPHGRLVKVDIKDFYMSGLHSDLARDAASIFKGTIRDTVRHFILFVLQSQLVTFNGTCFKVRNGSGMGLLFSGELSDLCYYLAAEKHFALDQDVANHFGLDLWLRYKDDILVGFHSDRAMQVNFFECLRRESKYFLVEVEQFGQAVPMLDIWVSRPFDSDRLGFAPYEKPTSIRRWLSHGSHHPIHVHRAWPAGQIMRFKAVSDSRRKFENRSFQFLSSLVEDHVSHTGLESALRAVRARPSPTEDRERCLWITLPYRGAWCRIGKTLKTILCNWAQSRYFAGHLFGVRTARVSWKLSCSSFSTRLRKTLI